MTERAAHLVDHVFPDVPIRQWVLSLPHRVRYALARRGRLAPGASDRPAASSVEPFDFLAIAPRHAGRFLRWVARPSLEYARRDPRGSVLYQIVRDHFDTFRVEAARLRDGDGLTRFVEAEFRAFLGCGWLGVLPSPIS